MANNDESNAGNRDGFLKQDLIIPAPEPDYKALYLVLVKRLQRRADGAQACLHILGAIREFNKNNPHLPVGLLLRALEATMVQMSTASPLVNNQDVIYNQE